MVFLDGVRKECAYTSLEKALAQETNGPVGGL